MRFFAFPLIVILGFVVSPALPASKDDSAADWIPFIPKAIKYWRDELADKGLAFSATYVGDAIGNVSGGIKRRIIS